MSVAAPPALPGAATGCFHCGLPAPDGATFGFQAAQGWRAFCCAGCEAVSRAISSQGLDDFYRVRAAAAPPSPERESDEDLALYDEPIVQERFVREVGEGLREASILVDGMRCSACAWLVEQVAARVPGVESARAHFGSRRALVRWDPAAARLSTVLAAIRAVGYPAWPYEPHRLAQVETRERRSMLRRLWVAGLGMMQVMMYAVPGYLARSGEIAPGIERLMHWAALVLTLPVVGYSAWPFFAGAWRSLRQRSLGMDVPVALGIGAAFTASAAATLRGSGAVYFDSVTMFVFLLTAGRYLEFLARLRAGLTLQRLERLEALAVEATRKGAKVMLAHNVLFAPGLEPLLAARSALVENGVVLGDKSVVTDYSRL